MQREATVHIEDMGTGTHAKGMTKSPAKDAHIATMVSFKQHTSSSTQPVILFRRTFRDEANDDWSFTASDETKSHLSISFQLDLTWFRHFVVILFVFSGVIRGRIFSNMAVDI